MLKDKLSISIEEDATTIECKKRAEQLFHINQENFTKKTIQQCQDLAAVELGYENYLDLKTSIKNKNEFMLKSNYELKLNHFYNLLQTIKEKDIGYVNIKVRSTEGGITFHRYNEKLDKLDEFYTEEYLNQLCQSIVYKICELSQQKAIMLNRETVLCINSLYEINHSNKEKYEMIVKITSVISYPQGYDFYIMTNQLMNKRTILNEMGFPQQQIRQLTSSIQEKSGLIMIGGVTSSGVTSTLKALSEISSIDKRKNIYNLSQPLEFKTDNVHNINIQPTEYKYFPYVEPMKTALNNHAEIIFMDKINDKCTTQLVYEAAKKALVVSTVNATSIFGVLERFKDGGLTREQIGHLGFLKLIGYQKLLPVVCDKCYHKVENIDNISDTRLHKEYKRFFSHFKTAYPEVNLNNIKLRNPQGCENCHNTGVMKRTVCAEIMEINETVLNYIRQDNLAECKQYYKSLSDKKIYSSNMVGKFVIENALYKMLQGYIDPLDLEMNFLPIEDFIKRL